MRRFLASFTLWDWFVVLGGLVLVGVIELDKRDPIVPPDLIADESRMRSEPEPEPPEVTPQLVPRAPPVVIMEPRPEGAPAPPKGTFLRPNSVNDPVVAMMMANPPATFDSPAVLRLDRDLSEFSLPMQKFFTETFQQKRYFGSVAVGPSGAYGWSADISALKEAREVALAFCAKYGPDCVIVADLVPKDLPKIAPRQSLTFVQSMALKGVRAQSGPRAFARSMDGSFGVGRESLPKVAEMKALTGCKSMQKPLADLAPMPCEIIAFWME